MNSVNRSSKFFLAVFLMMNLSNIYAAKIQVEDTEAVEAAGAEAVEASGVNGECRVDEACDAVAAVSEDEMYGGVQQEYVVKGCKVTIYNDGPVKMVNVKTDQPCNDVC